MRKLFILLISCLLISFVSSYSFAEVRNAFEFNQLYLDRLKTLDDEFDVEASYDSHMSMYSSAEYMNSFAGENEYFVDIPAGTILVSMPDFGVVRFEGTLIDLTKSDEEANLDIYRSAMAYAALEYTGVEDFSHSILKNFDKELSDSFIVDVVDEFADLINSVFEDESRFNELFKENGSIIPLASKNYEYSLQYYCGSIDGHDIEFISFIAEKK